MITPDYYPLEEAAEKLNCSKDRIIHFGATGKLPVYMLTSRYFVEVALMNGGHQKQGWMEHGRRSVIAKLSRYSLREFEAGNVTAAAIIEPEKELDSDGKLIGELRFSLKHQDMLYPSFEELREAQRKGINIDDIYPPPVMLKDCLMVVLADDLRDFGQAIQTSDSGNIDTLPHDLPNQSGKVRKKMTRYGKLSLELIDKFQTFYGIDYPERLSGIEAWARIVSGEYKDDLIASINDTKKSLTLIDGEKLTRSDFLTKYRTRFKKPKNTIKKDLVEITEISRT